MLIRNARFAGMLQLSASAPRLPQGPAARTPRRSAPQPAAAESVRRQLERQAIIDLPAARQTGGAQLATGPPADPAGSAQPAVARSGPRRPADPDHLPQPARPSQQGLTPESTQLQQAAPAPALAQAAARRRPFTKRPVAPEGALSGAASEQRDSGTAPQHGSGRHAESSSRSSGGDGGIGTVGGGSGSIGAPPSGGAARLLERPQLLQPDKPKCVEAHIESVSFASMPGVTQHLQTGSTLVIRAEATLCFAIAGGRSRWAVCSFGTRRRCSTSWACCWRHRRRGNRCGARTRRSSWTCSATTRCGSQTLRPKSPIKNPMQMCCLCDRDRHITVAVCIHAVRAEQAWNICWGSGTVPSHGTCQPQKTDECARHGFGSCCTEGGEQGWPRHQVSVREIKKLKIFSTKFNKLVTRRGLQAMRHLLIVQHLTSPAHLNQELCHGAQRVDKAFGA